MVTLGRSQLNRKLHPDSEGWLRCVILEQAVKSFETTSTYLMGLRNFPLSVQLLSAASSNTKQQTFAGYQVTHSNVTALRKNFTNSD
jgi:hypothetical protein